MTSLAPQAGLRLILGSGSPRRLELLAQIGVTPDAVCPPDIDETPQPGERPDLYVARMAAEKTAAIAGDEHSVILCADTTVFMGRQILGKPQNADEARAFLKKLAGRRHTVATAVALRRGDRMWQKTVSATVKMKPLTSAELDAYIASNEWQGKAGAYGIQGASARFIPWIQGSYTAIVGLPLAETAQLLDATGYRPEGGAK